MPNPNGFLYWCGDQYLVSRASVDTICVIIEFELGLELDSAEVRGILIYEGQDWEGLYLIPYL